MKAKITKATFKNFVKKNTDKLFIQYESSFDGMSDCVEFVSQKDRKFRLLKKKKPTEQDYIYGKERGISREEIENRMASKENTLGYHGIWLVGSSRDHFSHYEDDNFIGIEVYNCCGSFIIAITK